MVSSEFGYQKSEVAVHSGGSQSGGGESWREHLEKFVKNVKGTEKFPARTVRIAEAILNGRYTERPPLSWCRPNPMPARTSEYKG